MLKKIFTVSSLAALLSVTTACGKNESYIKDWSVQNQGLQFQVNAIFKDGFQIDGETRIPFKTYGSIFVGQNDAREMVISVEMNENAFNDIDLMETKALPTGEKFPNIVTGPLGMVSLLQEAGRWAINGYFGKLATGENAQKSLVAVGIELAGIDNTFPNITLTQNYFTKENYRFGSLTIYGPKLDANNQIEVPGGVFLAADLEAFKAKGARSRMEFMIGKKFEVSGPDAKRFPTEHDQQKVALKFVKAVEKAGIIRKRK